MNGRYGHPSLNGPMMSDPNPAPDESQIPPKGTSLVEMVPALPPEAGDAGEDEDDRGAEDAM